MNNDDLPGNWEGGHGGASRPVSDGGYYDKWFYRVLPGSNQHVERYLECHVYAENDRHVVEISEREEDDMESREVSHIGSERFEIPREKRGSERYHDMIESEVLDRAIELMGEQTEYEP